MGKSIKFKRFYLLFLIVMFWFGQCVYSPFFTPYLLSLGMLATMAGTIIGIYGFSQMILRIPLGIVSDSITNHKIFILMGPLTTIITSTILQSASSVPLFLLARTISGAGAATWVSFTIMYSNYYKPEESRTAMGLAMACCDAGCLLAYIVGGLFYEKMGIHFLFRLSTIFGIIAFIMACFLENTSTSDKRKPVDLSSFKIVTKNGSLQYAVILSVCIQFITCGTVSSFTTTVAKGMGANGAALALMSSLNMLSCMLSEIFISTKYAMRWKDKNVISIGFAIIAAYCILVPIAPNMIIIFALQFLAGIASGFIMSPLMARAIKDTPQSIKATSMAVFQSSYGIGMTLGPIAMGGLLDRFGITIAYCFMTICGIIGMIWSHKTRLIS